MDSKTFILLLSVIFAVLYTGTAKPLSLHASCTLKWSWTNVSCSVVSNAIINEIQKLSGSDCPTGTELCGYHLVSNTSTEIKGTHTTPVHKYVDDFNMNFEDSGTMCTVDGYSTSEIKFAILDDGTNYCNLHNLVTSAGLDKIHNFKEVTSDSECTQYSSADCGKY